MLACMLARKPAESVRRDLSNRGMIMIFCPSIPAMLQRFVMRKLTPANSVRSFVLLALATPLIFGCQQSSMTAVTSGQGGEVAATQKDDPTQSEDSDSNTDTKRARRANTGANDSRPDHPWLTFRGNLQSTGVAMGSLPDELEVLWKHEIKDGAFEGTAAIAPDENDPNRVIVYIGDLDGKLLALNFETGEPIWEYTTPIGFVAGVAYRDGLIFVGDIDGVFHCVNSKGEKVWTHQTEAEINSSANFYKDAVLVGSQDVFLYSLDAKSGELNWKLETADQVRCGITIAGNQAFVAGCDGGLHMVNLDDGTEISSVDIQSPTGVTPAVMDDWVYVGTEQSGFFAIDWKQAKVKWHFDAGGASIRSSAAVTNEHVIVGAQNRTVYSLDPASGDVQWSATLKAKIDSSPVVVDERVLIGSTDGRLFALNINDGKILWEKQLNGGIIGSPAVAYGKLVIATNRGVVYCLGSKQP